MARDRKRGAWAATAAIAAVALVFMLCRSAALESTYPVLRGRAMFARCIWTRCTGAARGAAAAAEAARLRAEVASLAVIRSDFEQLEAENARLRAALGYAERLGADWVPAAVLSRGSGATGAGERLLVGKGSLDGVRDGAAVVAPDGLVGRVTFVSAHVSEVALLADARVKVACEVEVAGGARPRGILCGGTEDALFMRHVTNADALAPRVRVVTSGIGGAFPRGIAVGTLVDVTTDEQGIVREAEIAPAVDCGALEDVFIRRER